MRPIRLPHLIALLAPLALSACHTDGAKPASDKTDAKTRDAMMKDNAQLQDQHWAAADPATSGTAAPAASASAASPSMGMGHDGMSVSAPAAPTTSTTPAPTGSSRSR